MTPLSLIPRDESEDAPAPERGGLWRRIFSFQASVLLHIAALAGLTFLERHFPAGNATDVPVRLLRVEKLKSTAIYYPHRDMLPEIAPERPSPAPGRTPRARPEAERRLIVRQTETPVPQVVQTPFEEKKPVRKVIQAPNLVAVAGPQPPALPTEFVPPPALRESPSPLPSTPQSLTRTDTPTPPPKPAPRRFIPPPERAPKLATNQWVVSEGLPDLTARGSDPTAAPTTLLSQSQISVPAPKPAAPASSQSANTIVRGEGASRGGIVTANPPPSATGGPSANLALLSPTPSRQLDEIPRGQRSGSFASGAEGTAGEPGGPGGSGSLRMSGIEATRRKRETDVPLPQTGRENEIRTRFRALSLSVPLPPNARHLPAAVERRFRGRPVYSIVIPKPAMAHYQGDWVIWFSPPASAQVPATGLAAPYPTRRPAPARGAFGAGAAQRVYVSVTINAEGACKVSPEAGAADPEEALARQDICAWSYSPAFRGGSPIEVEALFDLTLQLPDEGR